MASLSPPPNCCCRCPSPSSTADSYSPDDHRSCHYAYLTAPQALPPSHMLISTGSPLPSVPSKQVWRGWRPYINISETDCAFCLLANLPGAPKDAIRYDIGPDRCLTITVSTIDNHGWRKGYDGWVVWHYSTDTYQHQCRLPIGLDLDRIQCAIRDEFLFITIPRS